MASSIIPMPKDVHSLGSSTPANSSADFYIPYTYRGLIFCISADVTKMGIFIVSSNSNSGNYAGKVAVVPIHQGTDITYDRTVANQLTLTFSNTDGTAGTNVYSLDFNYASNNTASGIAPHKIE